RPRARRSEAEEPLGSEWPRTVLGALGRGWRRSLTLDSWQRQPPKRTRLAPGPPVERTGGIVEEEAGRPQEPQRDGRRTRRSAPLRPRLRSRIAAARTSADELAAAAEAEAASEAARLADEGSGARAAE